MCEYTQDQPRHLLRRNDVKCPHCRAEMRTARAAACTAYTNASIGAASKTLVLRFCHEPLLSSGMPLVLLHHLLWHNSDANHAATERSDWSSGRISSAAPWRHLCIDAPVSAILRLLHALHACTRSWRRSNLRFSLPRAGVVCWLVGCTSPSPTPGMDCLMNALQL